MTNFATGISPEVLRALGWTLLHFVWQGAGLAALFAVAMAVCRSANARYAAAVATLGFMVASAALTLGWELRQTNADARPEAARFLLVAKPVENTVVHAQTDASNLGPGLGLGEGLPLEQPKTMLWLVEAWFLGVVLLSLRTAGGLLVIARMRRKESKPVARELYETCLSMQRKMGLDRVIRYCEFQRLDAPAVLGWFRPVVLLPVRALTGLTAEQIAMVIAHELAHIRRFDSFVNFFQVAVETLLFYHPAVWWVSQRIRVERENCCDDEAIAVCGDAVNYARALTLMEEWRTAPSLLMAANRGPLAGRVLRLLGLGGGSSRTRVAGLGVSLLCFAGAILAGNAFLGVAHASLGASASPRWGQESSSVIVIKPETAAAKERTPQAAKPSTTAAPKPQPENESKQQKTNGNDNKKGSFIEAMEAAGFKNLTVDELIAMKIHGVTPEYIKAVHDMGLQPDADELIGMRVQGITPEYIRDMKTVAAKLSVDELIGMKVQGITLQYVKGLRDLDLQPDADELIGMKVQGVTPDYVRELRATGLTPSVDELIGMKVQGITPEYVKGLQAAGFKNLDCDELIGAKVQGVTPEFIEKARKHGFQNLTLDQLIALKQADIL